MHRVARHYPRLVVSNEEIIDEGETGYCVPDSEEALREAIERILWDPALQARMGRAAQAACRARYSWPRHVDHLLKLVFNLKPET